MTNEAQSMNNQDLLEKIVHEYFKNQKRKQRVRLVFRIILAVILFFVLLAFFSTKDSQVGGDKPHVGLIDINGNIFDMQFANAENFIKGLEKAYKNKGLSALIVRINSPGGSPVQADYMFNALQMYRKKNPDVPTYAVCVDMCASAAYYVAVGADKIYANPSSMVGSIGVLFNGFGFVDSLHKIGATRRLQTAGSNKGFLDPFSPEKPEQVKQLQVMLDDVHHNFIEAVKTGRGNRLHVNNDTFSGLIWTGTQAYQQGLIDGFASSGQLARDVIKVDKVVDYTHQQSMFERVAKNIGTAMASQMAVSLGLQPGFN